MRRVRLLQVLLIATGVELVGLVANTLTTFLSDRVGGFTAWALTPVVAVLAGMAKVVIDVVGGDEPRPAETAHGRGGTRVTAAVLVLLTVVGAGGFAVTAGARYAVGWVTGKESGTDHLVRPVTRRAGRVSVTVESVVFTRHFTRVGLAVRNTGSQPVALPVGFAVLSGADGTTLQADPFRSDWTETVPPGGFQRGTVTFGGKLPDAVRRATFSFAHSLGTAADGITVRDIGLRPG